MVAVKSWLGVNTLPRLIPPFQMLDFLEKIRLRQMHLINTAAVAFLVAAFTASPISAMDDALEGFKICSKVGDALEITAIHYSPHPPVPGQNFTVSATGSLRQDIVAGTTAHVKVVAYGVVTVIDKDYDVCSLQDVKCPIKATQSETISFTFEVPSNAPSKVSVKLNAILKAPDGTEIFCISNPNFIV